MWVDYQPPPFLGGPTPTKKEPWSQEVATTHVLSGVTWREKHPVILGGLINKKGGVQKEDILGI